MNYIIDKNNARPAYLQLYEYFVKDIISTRIGKNKQNTKNFILFFAFKHKTFKLMTPYFNIKNKISQ